MTTDPDLQCSDKGLCFSKILPITLRVVVFTLVLSTLSFAPLFSDQRATAATVTASGTNPSVCNQEVGNSTNVVAYRLSGGDCVIEFQNVGSTTWTVPNNASSIRFLLVGGGGSGYMDSGGGGGVAVGWQRLHIPSPQEPSLV